MKDTVKINVSIKTNVVGSECVDTLEIERQVWEAMSQAEREAAAQEAAWSMAEWNWEVSQ